MYRRTFLTSMVASTAFPSFVSAYAPSLYAPTTWRDIRDTNEKIVVNFRASWSLTCQMKDALLTELLQEEAKYRALKFVVVDWDTFGTSQWTERSMKVKRNSTLIALKNTKEVGRVVNQPFERSIRRFLDDTLAS